MLACPKGDDSSHLAIPKREPRSTKGTTLELLSGDMLYEQPENKP